MFRAAALVALAALGCGPRGEPVRTGGPATSVTIAPAPPAPPRMGPPAGHRLTPDVAPTGYRLTLELDPSVMTFRGEVTIDLVLAAPTDQLWLHARDLEIEEARVELGGQVTPLPVTTDAARELIGLDLGRPAQGSLRVTLPYRGAVAPGWTGLFRESVGDARYLFTQFQAMSARRAVPCFDEPGWKVPWEVTLVVPPGLVAVGNAPEVARATRADGRVEVRFAATPPMPSYLLAVAVGPFDIVDVGPVGRARVPARILVPAGHAADAAVAAAALPRLVTWMEAYLDRPLPLAKLDSVAVPYFFGAMENPGLITYAESMLLTSPVTPAAALRPLHLGIAAHELAHQWFGNEVTMAWWDDLWLNEAFATWLAAKALADLDPRRDVALEGPRARAAVMAQDERPGALTVRRPVATSAEAEAAFHPLLYGKGAALLAMYERATGAVRFRAAVRAYLAAHAGGNATTADLGAALAEAWPAAAAGLLSFLDQPGVPRVEVALDCAGPPTVVATVTSSAPAWAPPVAAGWRFPLCVRFPDKARGGGAVTERCGWLAEGGGRVDLGAAACPAWVIGDAGGAGYYRVAYPPALAAALQARLREVPVVDRGGLAAGVSAELSGGRTTVAEALAWADRLLAAPHRHDTVAAALVLQAVDRLVAAADRPGWQRWLRARVGARARAAGVRARPGETAAAALARRSLVELAGIQARDPAVIALAEAATRAWLDGGTALGGADLALVLRVAAGGGDAALGDRLRTRLLEAGDRPTRQRLLAALASAASPAAIARALDLVRIGPLRLEPSELLELIGGLLATPEARDPVWAAVATRPSLLTGPVPMLLWPGLIASVEHLCTAAQRAEVEALFAPLAPADPAVAPALADALAAIDACVARRAHHADGLAAALSATSP